MFFAVDQGASPLGRGKGWIYFVYRGRPLPRGPAPWASATRTCIYLVCITCNTHAYIRWNIDACIRCPYMHAYIRCLAAAAAAFWGLASPDFDTWSDPDAEDLRNHSKRLASPWALKMAPSVINVYYQIRHLFEMLDLDTCLTPDAENWTG